MLNLRLIKLLIINCKIILNRLRNIYLFYYMILKGFFQINDIFYSNFKLNLFLLIRFH